MYFSVNLLTFQVKLKHYLSFSGKMSIEMFKTEELMKVRFLGTMKGWLNSKCKTPVCENDLSFISGSGLLWS